MTTIDEPCLFDLIPDEPPTIADLYDLTMRQAAEAAKLDASARADAHADAEWRDAAYMAVLDAAASHDDFTADDVWPLIDATISTHEPSALGPVFLRASKAGAIRKTGVTRPSTNPVRHRDLTVWEAAS